MVTHKKAIFIGIIYGARVEVTGEAADPKGIFFWPA